MPEAFIFDAVRTPRGRGRPDGSRHSITPVSLAAQVFEALRDRNDLNTARVDDVVLDCHSPVGSIEWAGTGRPKSEGQSIT